VWREEEEEEEEEEFKLQLLTRMTLEPYRVCASPFLAHWGYGEDDSPISKRSSQTGDAGAVRKAREEEEEGRNHHTCESLLRLTLAPGTLSSVHKKKVAHLGLTNL
jgi:hypothetical protein